MPTETQTPAQLIQAYFEALCGKPKTEDVIDTYVADPHLKQHILATEAAFPGYDLVPEQMISEGNTVAVRGTFRGTHQGPFMGFQATGKTISAACMLFYEITDGRITAAPMLLDMPSIWGQLNS